MSYEISMPSHVLLELAAVLAIIVIGISSLMPGIDRWSRRYFIAFYIVQALGGIIFAIDMSTYMDPNYLELTRWFPPLEYLVFSLPFLLLNLYLTYCCGMNWRKSGIFRITISLWGLFLIILIVAQSTPIFYHTDPTGRFYVTSWHPLLFAPLVAMSIIGLITLITKRKGLSRKYFYAFLLYIIIVTITVIVHSFIFTPILINIAFFIGSVTMYLLILSEQVNQYMNQKIAISTKNANIMVLQMRPHFIYNTMTSIYYLCEQNPKKAQQVILDFTSYLRKNFNAMVSTDPIPFTEELEHVRAYLAVELTQFEDSLFVDYDIPHTQFRLPPLSLQPLVENAIKHGVDPELDPLHILIQTLETKSGNVIVVKDDGPGFDPADAFHSQSALSNIKQRLELMCHGSITITSREGEGTLVKIVIPQAKT
ncbi:MAG: histidine kinase [Lachnospiraceae bacterium]|nr:histidine kinase [Lachnospiraceae bacterium]